jgi:hypothetical protein
VELEEGPERDDESIDFVIGPEPLLLGGEGLTNHEPFGGVSELRGHPGVEMLPGAFHPVVEVGVVALSQIEAGKAALVDVRIEIDGGVVPDPVHVLTKC